jgi:hypothetical protein
VLRFKLAQSDFANAILVTLIVLQGICLRDFESARRLGSDGNCSCRSGITYPVVEITYIR